VRISFQPTGKGNVIKRELKGERRGQGGASTTRRLRGGSQGEKTLFPTSVEERWSSLEVPAARGENDEGPKRRGDLLRIGSKGEGALKGGPGTQS